MKMNTVAKDGCKIYGSQSFQQLGQSNEGGWSESWSIDLGNGTTKEAFKENV